MANQHWKSFSSHLFLEGAERVGFLEREGYVCVYLLKSDGVFYMSGSDLYKTRSLETWNTSKCA